MGWTSIYQLFWCELQGYKVLTHCQLFTMADLRRKENLWKTVVGWSTVALFHVPIIFHSCLSWNLELRPPRKKIRVRLRSLALSETPEPPTSHRLRFIIYGVRAQATGECCAAGVEPDIRKNRYRSVSVSIVAGTRQSKMLFIFTSFRSCRHE